MFRKSIYETIKEYLESPRTARNEAEEMSYYKEPAGGREMPYIPPFEEEKEHHADREMEYISLIPKEVEEELAKLKEQYGDSKMLDRPLVSTEKELKELLDSVKTTYGDTEIPYIKSTAEKLQDLYKIEYDNLKAKPDLTEDERSQFAYVGDLISRPLDRNVKNTERILFRVLEEKYDNQLSPVTKKYVKDFNEIAKKEYAVKKKEIKNSSILGDHAKVIYEHLKEKYRNGEI